VRNQCTVKEKQFKFVKVDHIHTEIETFSGILFNEYWSCEI